MGLMAASPSPNLEHNHISTIFNRKVNNALQSNVQLGDKEVKIRNYKRITSYPGVYLMS